MRRRTSTLVAAVLLVMVVVGVGTVVRVPFVALGPGPTYDTLGAVDGTQVVAVDGAPTFPTSGHLNMTTVSVNDGVTGLQALGFWLAPDRRLVPRDTVFPPGRSTQEVDRENAEQFTASETNAELAALSELKLPTRATVADVVPGSPAEGVLQQGDTIVAVRGTPVATPQAVADALNGTRPGEPVVVTYRRGDAQQDATITLGSSPDRDQGMLGVRPGVQPVSGAITISLGDIGGPSAGLMFALAVVDKLTPGELNGGQFVAGTGTITADGTVGPIGGIPFKMRAARDAGAVTFLVPSDNCAEAVQNAPDGLRLVRVTTLASAVDALETLDGGGQAPLCTP
ncbi:PDZ domain-containing protein [Pseudonocardia halophobica]|uniref:endopeptidase La n=1 Tax=Pseudonocardia halophobica TaxID=29401 RepID=A0A9W6NXM9_9PSEU|nr:PDZ domain-containing protein [Pseudonocardia halophobica]GLL12883.1 PDZ domain-containing protein [Pseudonocardia halophobica]